jgi:dynein heavy chain
VCSSDLSGEPSVADARERLAAWAARLAGLRARERALGPAMDVFEIPAPDYPQLAEVERDVEGLGGLWDLAGAWEADWSAWKTGAFSSLDLPGMEEGAARYTSKLNKAKDRRSWGVWGALEARVKDFRATLPLIQALGNPAMRDRHWRALMKEVGAAFDPTAPDFTLESAFDLGFPEAGDFIQDLSAAASKEVAIETALVDLARTEEGGAGGAQVHRRLQQEGHRGR